MSNETAHESVEQAPSPQEILEEGNKLIDKIQGFLGVAKIKKPVLKLKNLAKKPLERRGGNGSSYYNNKDGVQSF